MSASTLTYRIQDGRVVVFEGVFDELGPSVLEQLAKELAPLPEARFDLAGVRRINSLGVRAWVDFMKKLAGKPVVFLRCSPAFIDQLNTVSDFRGHARIESFLVPYVCETSGNVYYEELTVGRDIKHGDYSALEGRPCKVCPQPLVFDDLPERYLSFLAFV